ncbi:MULTISPECIES: imidazole glycerol phosphate synthase subunit HisF [Brevibacterium]|uniref:Imidazole glycerol phosphate synthase subunit HisF n=1 Tax=Brevibacterium sediminis TaxID=1857024 RepID=A0A5C4X6I6_9MICO|nr:MULTISPECIES: imidazole glycerol phosphate synthase subunit HisF [Brevibacterium]MCS4592095.1 imidazole glycerol phosphate synthase subunit HisF [Brevibacterium sediminis]TNM58219.1 imidazole glycerol phosphate synthase subunit HisF [Brevibacterium sediminis]UZD60854.1 imidazole glycerol phosphate synthase subunit HisF [Brevibacterium sp. JSBI002]GGC27246.1 imidazole glycerol phosphate synthase subunit HisF [Brevibacterium sediminis]
MVAVRVIPCLDVDGGRVVKGVKFADLRDAGDPVELARRYGESGADELTFLDVTASSGDRETVHDVVRACAEEVFIPLTVGGGIRSVADVDRLLRDGADKVSVNTSAVKNPELISEISRHFGNQVLVLSLDARRAQGASTESGFEVTTRGGREGTGRCAIDWIREAADRGVGEILLNSIDADGTREGFDLELIRAARAAVDVPLIASGGAGKVEHFAPAVEAGADALLAASVFHFGTLSIAEVKDALRAEGIDVR